MTQEVLPGLVYSCCEVNIDDVLVYGKDDDDYIANLRLVFQRFREKKITINPDKCVFGADEVEFVGHVLDAEGATFSRTKFDSVLEFAKPTNMKELRSFVGLVNYFRDHIQNHSIITQPLQMMITESARTRMIRVPGKKPSRILYGLRRPRLVLRKLSRRLIPALNVFHGREASHFLHTDASDYAKNLGVMVTNELDWEKQIIRNCSTATFTAKTIFKSLYFKSIENFKLLYKTITRPKLEYANLI
jgi:hypothetical protein